MIQVGPALVLVLLLQFSCGPAIGSGGIGQEDGEKHTLYFLSMLPYLDLRLSTQPSFIEDTPEIIEAVTLAIQQINNRTDLLKDYHIELIEGNGGCDIETLARETFVRNIFHSGKQIVGIVGPGCSDSSVAVSSLCSRSEIALITVHFGSTPHLANRIRFPYAFATSDTSFDDTNAALELIKYNNWRTVAVLYDVATLVYADRFLHFQREINNLAGYDMVFSAAIINPDTPLQQLRESFARIIIAFVGLENICKLICMASHEQLVFPSYQWVFVGNEPTCFQNVSFTVLDETYQCTADQQIVSMQYMLDIIDDCSVKTSGNLSYWHNTDLQEYETINTTLCDSSRFYDGVWSLALTMNSSIEILQQNNLSLLMYRYGQKRITRIIQEQFYELDFNGATGHIKYNQQTGSRRYTRSLYQIVDEHGNNENLGSYDIAGEWNISNDATFLPDHFPSIFTHVSEVAAAFALISSVITAILVGITHILTVIYRNYSSVKASSPRLNHFVYAGCYAILFSIVTYTVTETFQSGYGVYSALCNITAWSVNLGFTLILSTVCAKTWRLYDIFVLSSQNMSNSARFSDHRLAVFIAVVLSVDITLCTIWSSVDPLVRETKKILELSDSAPDIKMEYHCKSKTEIEVVMISISVISKVIILACSAYLAFLTRRIPIPQFKTNSVTRLVYLVCLVYGVGLPTFFLTQQLNNRNIHYVILCVLLNRLVVLCLALLFFLPLLPLLKQKFIAKGVRAKPRP